jgi:hypothetical protein
MACEGGRYIKDNVRASPARQVHIMMIYSISACVDVLLINCLLEHSLWYDHWSLISKFVPELTFMSRPFSTHATLVPCWICRTLHATASSASPSLPSSSHVSTALSPAFVCALMLASRQKVQRLGQLKRQLLWHGVLPSCAITSRNHVPTRIESDVMAIVLSALSQRRM